MSLSDSVYHGMEAIFTSQHVNASDSMMTMIRAEILFSYPPQSSIRSLMGVGLIVCKR